MIEAGANEIKEEKMIEAILWHMRLIRQSLRSSKWVAEIGKRNMHIQAVLFRKKCSRQCASVTPEEMEEAVFTDVKTGSRGKYPCHYRKTGRGICRE